MLDGRRVLIVEDEALVALELTEIVTGANAHAVGRPGPTAKPWR